MADSIPAGLLPYVPPSFYQGGTLAPGIDIDEAIQVAQGIQAKADTLPPAEKELFLAMVAASDIAPNGEVPPNLDEILDVYAAAAEIASSPTKWKDSLELLARLMVEQAGEQRHNALQDRLNAREQAKTELLSQAATLTEQASQLREGAMKSMVLSIVFASLSILAAGAAVAGGGAQGMGKADSFGNMIAAGNSAMKAVAGGSQGFGSGATSLGQIGQSTSGYESTMAQSAAKEEEAKGMINAAQAQELQAQADIKKEMQDSLNDMIKAIMNFLKELADAKAQQMQVMTKV